MDIWWQATIIDFMKTYPNIYTDTSWIIGETWKIHQLAKMIKKASIMQERLLYGSDFYMVNLSNSDVRKNIDNLKAEIGGELFERISTINPIKFLT